MSYRARPESRLTQPRVRGTREAFALPRWGLGLALALGLGALTGCASVPQAPARDRAFDFRTDTFAFANGLVWEYRYDANGNWTTRKREPAPDYAQHCFVVARSARQFFENARFAPERPPVDARTYRKLIREVVSASPRKKLPEAEKVVIPGYANLKAFSAAHEEWLKEECGGAWQCYVQRGNWRVIFPFSRHYQKGMAEQVARHLRESGPVVVHLVRFPQLTINHAVLIYAAREETERIEFETYDPNEPGQPTVITYDRARETFLLPANAYFQGGKVNVYEIYWKWDY